MNVFDMSDVPNFPPPADAAAAPPAAPAVDAPPADAASTGDAVAAAVAAYVPATALTVRDEVMQALEAGAELTPQYRAAIGTLLDELFDRPAPLRLLTSTTASHLVSAVHHEKWSLEETLETLRGVIEMKLHSQERLLSRDEAADLQEIYSALGAAKAKRQVSNALRIAALQVPPYWATAKTSILASDLRRHGSVHREVLPRDDPTFSAIHTAFLNSQSEGGTVKCLAGGHPGCTIDGCCMPRMNPHGLSISVVEVQSIERIENHVAWKMYAASRQTCRDNFRHDGIALSSGAHPAGLVPISTSAVQDSLASLGEQLIPLEDDVNEVLLWHGTDMKVLDGVAEGGIDFRFASDAGMYGNGAYFAEDSCKSAQYVSSSVAGSLRGKQKLDVPHCMLLCRVTLGAAHLQLTVNRTLKKPPPRPSNALIAYDSNIAANGTDRDQRHREFLIYASPGVQVYPEFIVTFSYKVDIALKKKILIEIRMGAKEAFVALRDACDDLKNDGEVVLAAVAQNGLALQFAFDGLKGFAEVVHAAVAQNWGALKFASDEFKANPDFVLLAVAQNGRALKYACAALRADHDFILAVVVQNGLALRYASDELKKDRDVVFVAVTQNGLALQFASDDLKGVRDVVLAAVAQNGLALQFASAALQAEGDVVLAAVAQNGNALQYASGELKQDAPGQPLDPLCRGKTLIGCCVWVPPTQGIPGLASPSGWEKVVIIGFREKGKPQYEPPRPYSIKYVYPADKKKTEYWMERDFDHCINLTLDDGTYVKGSCSQCGHNTTLKKVAMQGGNRWCKKCHNGPR